MLEPSSIVHWLWIPSSQMQYTEKDCLIWLWANNSEAIVLFDQALAMDPKFKQAYDAKGLAFEAENKYA